MRMVWCLLLRTGLGLGLWRLDALSTVSRRRSGSEFESCIGWFGGPWLRSVQVRCCSDGTTRLVISGGRYWRQGRQGNSRAKIEACRQTDTNRRMITFIPEYPGPDPSTSLPGLHHPPYDRPQATNQHQQTSTVHRKKLITPPLPRSPLGFCR